MALFSAHYEVTIWCNFLYEGSIDKSLVICQNFPNYIYTSYNYVANLALTTVASSTFYLSDFSMPIHPYFPS